MKNPFEGIRLLIMTGFLNVSKVKSIFDPMGVKYDIIHEVYEISDRLIREYYHGFIVDSYYLSKIPSLEKPILSKYFKIIMTSRIIFDKTNEVILIVENGENITLSEYLEKCKINGPRKLRTDPRLPINLNVILSEKKFTKDKSSNFKTFTFNLSRGGCFLYANKSYKIGKKVYLRIMELKDKTPVIAIVKWSVIWGKSTNIPGIGVEFISMTERQKRELFWINHNL